MVVLSDIRIRNGRVEDASELAQLFHASVREIGKKHYSQKQLQAWSPEPPDPEKFVPRIRDGRTFLVASTGDGPIVAYGDLERDGHIDHLYCRPDAAGTGVAALIYDQLEAIARMNGIRCLFVEASEPALGFFARRGFDLLERNDFQIAGVAIHNYRMEKKLGA